MKSIKFINFQREQLRKKWSLALDKTIKASDHVCELHFRDRDIRKVNIKDSSDISNSESSNKRNTLKTNAVPSLTNQEDSENKVGQIFTISEE